MSCEFKEKTRWYCENFEKIVEIEEHIASCEECRKLLDMSTEKIEFPKTDGGDEGTDLLKKVLKRKRGLKRILIFSIIGMVMGFFSFVYREQSIFILKLIIAVPYKIMEMVMLYIRPDVKNIFAAYEYLDNSIFLRFRLLNGIAERVVPCLIGGCIYGSIGYITGDKDIFTLKKFVIFVSKWIGATALCIGLLFGTYYYAADVSYRLEDISGFMIATSSGGTGYDGSTGVYRDRYGDEFEILVKGLNERENAGRLRGWEDDELMPVTIFGKWYFEISAKLDTKNNLLYIDNGDAYKVPESFVNTCINIEK